MLKKNKSTAFALNRKFSQLEKSNEIQIIESQNINQLPVPQYESITGKENQDKNGSDSSILHCHSISDNDLFDNSYLNIGQGLRSRHTLGQITNDEST